MGNTNTKEARDSASPRSPNDPRFTQQQALAGQSSRQRARASRSDLGSLLGMGQASSSSTQPPYERRETKQEREARRLEKERQARLVERERSLKEEHVDGGYLVTLGVYVGAEDYSKPTVRQLQIERKIAPFWRGLNDFSETWNEHQIIAVARGLPLPAADATPPEELIPRPMSAGSPSTQSHNLNSLTIPIGGRTQSAASDRSGSGIGSTIPSPSSAGPARNSSPFKHRPKGIAAALSISSRNGSTTEIVPREIKLAHDPFVNGQPVEVFLYKDAAECPICFLYYPPYLNHTRCCDQPICSECFVQIKRADPHYPEGHGENENPTADPEEQAGLLISEPACCPYCQQPEFGVTYDPPPFRRGLAYSNSGPNLGVGTLGTAMSSSSSLGSNLSPTSMTSPSAPNRRRTQSLSANAPNVITTDRVRPDWATKLAAQRAHIARRAAAATALHTAAFLMGNSETRTFRVGRFSRRNTGSGTAAGPSSGTGDAASPEGAGNGGGQVGASPPATMEPGPRGSSGRGMLGGSNSRTNRMEDLEEMMFAEAIRLSLAAEEERKRKSEKEERKEAKRKDKEEKKAAKAAAKSGGSGPYGGSGGAGSGHSSVSGSSLSLPSLGLGRRRGNSAASNLRVEASVASAMAATVVGSPSASSAALATDKDKGKGIDRSPPSASKEPTAAEGDQGSSSGGTSSTAAQPIPSPPNRAAGPSHLRQMSSASSITTSSVTDTPAGSYRGPSHLQDPRSSGHSLGGHSNGSEEAGEQGDRGADRDPSNSTEPMFNFTSLAEMVGVQLEGEHAGRRISAIGRDAVAGGSSAAHASDEVKEEAEVEQVEDSAASVEPQAAEPEQGVSAGSTTQSPAAIQNGPVPSPPELVVTPGTPAVLDDAGVEDSKQLGLTEVVPSTNRGDSTS